MNKLAEQFVGGKFQLTGFSAGSVIKELQYVEVSNMLDAIIMDIQKWKPELFNSGASWYIQPTFLKMYLFIHCLDFLKTNGSLSLYTGAPGGIPISTRGFLLPRALYVWLVGLAQYQEGGCVASTYFQLTAMPATGTLRGLNVGSPVVTNLSISSAYAVDAFKVSTAGGEMAFERTAISSVDMITWWATYGATYSGYLAESGYGCVAMTEETVRACDGSAWTAPFTTGITALNTSAAVSLSNVFDNWNAEVGMLYLDWSTGYSVYPAAVVKPVPRPPGAYGLDAAGSPTEVTDSCRVLRENYVFLMRLSGQDVGKPILPIHWEGEKVHTLGIVPVPINRNLRARASQYILNGLAGTASSSFYATDISWAWAYFYTLYAADWRRIQRSNPRYEIRLMRNSAGSSNSAPAPQFCEYLRLTYADAIMSGEVGCVIHNGQLWAPQAECLGGTFTNGILNLGFDDSMVFGYAIYGGALSTGTTAFPIASSLVLNGAWNTAWIGSGGISTPWLLAQVFSAFFMEKLAFGGNFDRMEGLTWPITTNPRGGNAMFARVLFAALAGGYTPQFLWINTVVDFPDANALIGITSPTQMSQFDIGLILCAGYSRFPAATGPVANAVLKKARYVLSVPPGWVSSPAVVNTIMATVNTGGAQSEALSRAMKRLHVESDLVGVVSGVDDQEGCLIHALKPYFHSLTQTLVDMAPAAAAAVCAPGGPVLQAACGSVTQLFAQKVKDLSKNKTNRQSYSYGQARKIFTTDIKDIVKVQRPGEPVTMGPDLGESLPVEQRAPAQRPPHSGESKSKPKNKQEKTLKKLAKVEEKKAELKKQAKKLEKKSQKQASAK